MNTPKPPTMISVLAAALATVCTVYAQPTDLRIWGQTSRLNQVSMLNSKVWMQIPQSDVQQDGDVVTWPAIRGISPTISVRFEATDMGIAEYAAQNPNRFGATQLILGEPDENGSQPLRPDQINSEWEIRSRIVYGKIWEIEALQRVRCQRRVYRRIFETQSGVVVVTASAEARSWKHPYVTQMLKAMKSVMVFDQAPKSSANPALP